MQDNGVVRMTAHLRNTMMFLERKFDKDLYIHGAVYEKYPVYKKLRRELSRSEATKPKFDPSLL